jgi:ABC-type multidrug transport system ATPase subunit
MRILWCQVRGASFAGWPGHTTPKLSFLLGAALRLLALDGIAVCGTVHSPSPDTFALFDRILVLQKGRVVYFGPNGGSFEMAPLESQSDEQLCN